MTILIDGGIFAQPDEVEAIAFWQQVIPGLVKRLRTQTIYYLNRSDSPDFPDIAELKQLFAPAPDFTISAIEDRRLAALCQELAIDVFLSTYNTSAGNAAQSLVVTCEPLTSYQVNAPILLAQQRALRVASRYLALFPAGANYLETIFPLSADQVQIVYPHTDQPADWLLAMNFLAKAMIELTTTPLSSLQTYWRACGDELTQVEATYLRPTLYGNAFEPPADLATLPIELRAINLIAFPDWQQPEDILIPQLMSLCQLVLTHADRASMTLVLATGNIAVEDADLTLSAVMLELLAELEIDTENSPNIALTGQLTPQQWQVLGSAVQLRVQLEGDDQATINAVNFASVPTVSLS